MTSPTADHIDVPLVEVSALSDGLVVRLAGSFGPRDTDMLRSALLRPRPSECRDVLIDAGGVTSIDDGPLAVLIAAPVWADETGAQLSYTRLSEPLRAAAAELGMMRSMPMLPSPGTRGNC